MKKSLSWVDILFLFGKKKKKKMQKKYFKEKKRVHKKSGMF